MKITIDFFHKDISFKIPALVVFLVCIASIAIIFSFLNPLGTSPDFWSALAAIGSFSVAVLMFNNDKKQEQYDFKSDLYNLISVLIGFIDFVQKTIAHNTTALSDCHHILESIGKLDKNMLDYNKRYFFNDQYDRQVLEKNSDFVQEYLAWKGFKSTRELENFTELNGLISLQINAIDALLQIVKCYGETEDKVVELIKPVYMDRMKIIKSRNQRISDQLRYSCHNLYFLNNTPTLKKMCQLSLKVADEEWNSLYSCLIANSYRMAFEKSVSFPFNMRNLAVARKYFFCTYIEKFNIYSSQQTTTIHLINYKQEELDFDKFCNFIGQLGCEYLEERERNKS